MENFIIIFLGCAFALHLLQRGAWLPGIGILALLTFAFAPTLLTTVTGYATSVFTSSHVPVGPVIGTAVIIAGFAMICGWRPGSSRGDHS